MKAIILAGGQGTRLSEETLVNPKPMVSIGGMPILWHIMKHYYQYGHKDFVLALGYKGDYIKKYFLDYNAIKSDLEIDLKSDKTTVKKSYAENWKIMLSETGKNSMTGGRLLRLKDLLKDEDCFMLTYGDGIADIDISNLIRFHKSHGKTVTISGVRPPARFGELIEKDGHFWLNSNEEYEYDEHDLLNSGWTQLNLKKPTN